MQHAPEISRHSTPAQGGSLEAPSPLFASLRSAQDAVGVVTSHLKLGEQELLAATEREVYQQVMPGQCQKTSKDCSASVAWQMRQACNMLYCCTEGAPGSVKRHPKDAQVNKGIREARQGAASDEQGDHGQAQRATSNTHACRAPAMFGAWVQGPHQLCRVQGKQAAATTQPRRGTATSSTARSRHTQPEPCSLQGCQAAGERHVCQPNA